MKNTYTLMIEVDEDCVVIEGICPHCMDNEELELFIKIIHHILNEAVEEAQERIKNGKKKQGTQKKRQKNLCKSRGQNKKD